MGSKKVESRQRSSTAVQAAVRNYLHIITRGLSDIYGEETGPAIGVLLDRALDKLVKDTMEMVKADDLFAGSERPQKLSNSNRHSGSKAAEDARQDAIERYDRTFAVTANLVSTLLAVAGEEDLACRVRPSAERSGRIVDQERDTGEILLIPLGT